MKSKSRMSVTALGNRLSIGGWGKLRKVVADDGKTRPRQRTKRLNPDTLDRMKTLCESAVEGMHSQGKGADLLKAVRKAKAADKGGMISDSPVNQALFMAIPSSTPEERSSLESSSEIRHYKKGDSVQLGDRDAFIIILDGMLSMTNWAGQRTIRRQGTVYDRLLFSTNAFSSKVSILVVSQETNSGLNPDVRTPLKRAAVKNLVNESLDSMLEMGQPSWFKDLTQLQQDTFVDSLETLSLNTGDVAAERGARPTFLLVLRGELTVVSDQELCDTLGSAFTLPDSASMEDEPTMKVQQSQSMVREKKKNLRAAAKESIGAGMIFGTKQLMDDRKMETSVVAVSNMTSVFRITEERMNIFLKQPLNKVLRTNKIKSVLQCSALFSKLSEEEMIDLCGSFTERLYTHNQVIIKQGAEPQEVFVIQTGAVTVWIEDATQAVPNRKVRTLVSWDYFGERACITGEQASATCKAEGSCLCLVLSTDRFVAIARKLRQTLENRIATQDVNLQIGDMRSSAMVQRGWFGNTHNAHPDQDLFTCYAVKVIAKRKVHLKREQDAVRLERAIGVDLSHDFLVTFVRTFQDTRNIYLTFEFCEGGDLFQLMRSHISFTKEAAQFYIASIVLALEYLHGCLVMHRDLRPENVLIDNNGYPKLAGFSCCRRLDPPLHKGRINRASSNNSAPPAPEKDRQPPAPATAWEDSEGAAKPKPKPVRSKTAAALGLAFGSKKKEETAAAPVEDAPTPIKESFGSATTICGAPEYLAPEIVLGNGYAQQVDWWALGIIACEIIVGNRPIGDANTKFSKLFGEILTADIAIPSSVDGDLSGPCLISRLLQRNPSLRLSSTRCSKVMENHSFFRGFNWEALAAHQLQPPLQVDIFEVRERWEVMHDEPLSSEFVVNGGKPGSDQTLKSPSSMPRTASFAQDLVKRTATMDSHDPEADTRWADVF